ncbi:puromycin-sensitive aminopeptidase-like [Schistocerca gregaria]|uniref:puromycin-sensitive aminopeptidase-like n=1 Tax=Schistocerca gregaria TaxID=7010 RepID=UPI00211E3B15|nr:puromycin-sensitive aminopeptidase-like [Schistocerca gregaria]
MCASNAIDRVLLPRNVQPIAYKLYLSPDLKAFTYSGYVEADLVVMQATAKSLTFHNLGNNLELDKTYMLYNTEKLYPVSDSVNHDEETVTLNFGGNPFVVGEQIKLVIYFNNTLGTSMCGFYRSKYMVGGEERWMATTQFEPVDARRAFPCWDEPALKATFEVILNLPSHLLALSNMPVVGEEKSLKTGTKTVYFQTTPRMSTYLLAFVVGEFDYVEGVTTKGGVPMRVYTPLNQADRGCFALEVGTKILDFFTDYFGIAYPLPKLDMIAIPDFAAGAMENWGLVTYREAALLCDRDANVSTKMRIAYVVAHEEAHQWFGNICSPEWWRELWLNEGFATWAGDLAVNSLFPEWSIWTQFCSAYLSSALRLDSMLSSHPIEVDVARSRDIDEIFDTISYNKGACVIRMLASYLGEKEFAKGLNCYLKRHSYGNATTADLWKAISEATGRPVGEMMRNWTLQMGYPVIHVESIEEGSKLRLSQTRFLADGLPTAEQDKVVWDVKVSVASDRTREMEYLSLSEKTATFDYSTRDLTWFKANAGQYGTFRVRYSADLLKKLVVAIKKKQILPEDRLGIVSDYMALSRAGLIPLTEVLELCSSYEEETDYNVWSELSAGLSAVMSIWESHPCYANFKRYKRQLFSKIGGRIGWEREGESDLDKLLRSVVLFALSTCDDEAVINEARRRFELYQSNPNSFPADLRDVVFRIYVYHGGAKEQEAMKEIYNRADVPDLKISALQALGLVQDATLIKNTIVWALNSGKVRNQDLHVVFYGTSNSQKGQEITWDSMKEHWDELVKRFGTGQFLLSRLIEYSTRNFSSFSKAEEIERFFLTHKANGIDRTVSQSLEKIRASASWFKRDSVSVSAWLNRF